MKEKLRITKKQKDEYSLLVKANMKRAYFSALGILGSHDEAMELSQEAFIRAYRYYNTFDKTRKFFTWYYKILRNLCLNRIRDRKNRKETSFIDYKETAELTSPESNFESEEIKNILEAKLLELDTEDREILILKEFEGHSYKEISELLGIPVGTVMSRLFYARKKLAKKMQSYI